MSTTKDEYAALLSLAAHELRTPAGVVAGYLRMLRGDAEEPLGERHRRIVLEAEKSIARLVELVTEMSDVSKLDAGILVLDRKPLELFSLVAEVAESVHEAQDRGVRLDVRGPAEGARLAGDAPRLRRSLEAFFRAILREKPSDTIVVADRRLDAHDQGRSAVIVIADEKAGERTHEASPLPFDENRGGVGLSLPLARRIVEAHGGRCWSPAEPGGRGAVIISLPL